MQLLTLLGVFGLGAQEIIIIVIAVLVLFGAKRIPEFMRGLGQGIREFKSAANNVQQDIRKELDKTEPNNNPPTSNNNQKTIN